MVDGLRTVWTLSNDEALVASARSAVASIEGWEVATFESPDELLAAPPVAGDVLIIDGWMRSQNVYEFCRGLSGRVKARTYIAVEMNNQMAPALARFAGAAGTLERPIQPGAMRKILERGGFGAPDAPKEQRGTAPASALPEALLADFRTGQSDARLIQATIDAETGLFNYAFLGYKVDEEFKRAKRFELPLAFVMAGFESQADETALRELAGIFLDSSRDTDVLGRFDENTFLFLLPNTGPDGAEIMARRVAASAEARNLKDLVGDPMVLSLGIATYPAPDLTRREDLFTRVHDALLEARHKGGGVVMCS
ncbi:MAG: GGDEF domain-containing protein [Planctomycetes bacterium]|nr:GGDEF domain-containing protein [Planctomycetota bacterium]